MADGDAGNVDRTVFGGRRLSDMVMRAFEHACETGDLVSAGLLLETMEGMARRPRIDDVERRRSVVSLVDAHHRLWNLRNPR